MTWKTSSIRHDRSHYRRQKSAWRYGAVTNVGGALERVKELGIAGAANSAVPRRVGDGDRSSRCAEHSHQLVVIVVIEVEPDFVVAPGEADLRLGRRHVVCPHDDSGRVSLGGGEPHGFPFTVRPSFPMSRERAVFVRLAGVDQDPAGSSLWQPWHSSVDDAFLPVFREVRHLAWFPAFIIRQRDSLLTGKRLWFFRHGFRPAPVGIRSRL